MRNISRWRIDGLIVARMGNNYYQYDVCHGLLENGGTS
jgi:hypothetical protein